jgi:hypothetical protein
MSQEFDNHPLSQQTKGFNTLGPQTQRELKTLSYYTRKWQVFQTHFLEDLLLS